MSDFSSKTPNEKSSYDPHMHSRNSIKPGAGAGVFREYSHRPEFADYTNRDPELNGFTRMDFLPRIRELRDKNL